jgi:hypothetical protein
MLYVKHNRYEHAHGHYTALAEKAIDLKKGEHVFPVPDIFISSGWLYVVGDAPYVGGTAVVAQAEGCRVLIYYYEEGSPVKKYWRVCYLEGDAGDVVWLHPWEGDNTVGEAKIYLTVGTFADVEQDANGRFKSWKVQNTGGDVVEEIEEIESTQQYRDIMDAVEEGRDTGGIG